MLAEQLHRDLEQSVQLRMRAIRQKISLAFIFCATVQTKVRFGQRDEAGHLLHKLWATMDHLQFHISPYTNLPDTFLDGVP